MDVQAKIITQFVRDLSFENPQGPMSFRAQTEKPEIKANIDVKATNQKDTNVFEIELNINVAAILNEKSVYLIDLKYVAFLGHWALLMSTNVFHFAYCPDLVALQPMPHSVHDPQTSEHWRVS